MKERGERCNLKAILWEMKMQMSHKKICVAYFMLYIQ